MNRLDVKKTYKLYIGGKFPRSESGRYLAAKSPAGEHLDNFAHASRKDFRDAVVAARAAVDGWSKATAYNRGQILYRAAEMLQNRASELVAEIARSTGSSAAKSKREVTLAVDRLVHFAGWTDKYSQVFGSVNPVASSHFDFTTPEPTGVVVVLAPDEPSLLALVSLVAPVILSGNTAIVVASEKFPLARRDVRRNSGHQRFAGRRGEHSHRQTRRTHSAHRQPHGRERDCGWRVQRRVEHEAASRHSN